MIPRKKPDKKAQRAAAKPVGKVRYRAPKGDEQDDRPLAKIRAEYENKKRAAR